ncbi:acyl-CoA dehydrogenase family protein [Actinomadura parmotrematis]|uniref:Acyl-CoA/acyl-ACP dehydrogenase n=1 Tax=Actinomadura parmotrematis TaxID=2864039 RepID=A0ABS7G5A0_9ACTN|nr:acyl-CoA dehydrogenase family protein [Actinomadura parmotrematis]MBW8487646.1 acyl-CoA/acyl-ACP dehydrogenase [Actinomadura parmotrematis]
MDFDLPESALAVREGVTAIARRYDQEYWSRCDADKRWPEEVWRELVDGGWHSLAIPEEHGGAGQGLLELAVALEALAAGGAGGAASFMYLLTPAFGGLTIARHGTPEQRAEFLPRIVTGEIETCFAITEPDAGSNAINIATHARRDGDGFLVSGQKIWISGVERADFLVLVARTVPAAEARPRTSGFTVLLVDVKDAVAQGTLTYQPIPKLGTNTVASSTVFLDEVRVPADRVLGEVGRGFAVLWDILNPERILAAASGVGFGELVLGIACDYARERAPFGTPIGANQAVAFPLARIKAQVELARLMTYKAAWLWDRGRPCGSEANVAKLTAADAAWQAADRAFQTHGGMAYSLEYPVARMFRDARIAKNIPVAEELVLAHIAQHELGLPRSY